MVNYEKRGHIGLLTIDRPEARNAVNGDVAQGMEAAIDELEADEEVWVGILMGNGPVFCAGADLKAISAGRVGDLQTERGGFGGIVVRDRTKPIIAAVDLDSCECASCGARWDEDHATGEYRGRASHATVVTPPDRP